jgi:hypothetical protein
LRSGKLGSEATQGKQGREITRAQPWHAGCTCCAHHDSMLFRYHP